MANTKNERESALANFKKKQMDKSKRKKAVIQKVDVDDTETKTKEALENQLKIEEAKRLAEEAKLKAEREKRRAEKEKLEAELELEKVRLEAEKEKRKAKDKSNAGRPSDRDEKIDYTKISAVIEVKTKRLMGTAINSYLADKHKTQNDLINTAILEYLKSKKKGE